MKYALLIFYAAGIYAAPFWVLDKDLPTTEIKDIGCKGNRFQDGQTFVYDYAGETLNNIEGASDRSTGIQLRTQVLITPIAECRFTMSLNGAELLSKSKNQDFQRTPDSTNFQKELERNELYFTMTDNKIISIQAPKDELAHILNIKRGILSTLQLNEDSTSETDINGNCNMELTKEEGKITKTKDLSECTQRAINEIGVQTSTIKAESTMKPLKSDSKCVYNMDGDMIKSVVCDETHLFRPFSAGYKSSSGAMTTVQKSMTFVDTRSVEPRELTIDIGDRLSLVFDHTTEEILSASNTGEQFDEVMSRLVNGDSFSATQQSAHEFTSLVYLLRRMNEKYMVTIWKKYFNCMESGLCTSAQQDLRDVYRQYLLDGIAYCGTSTCISMVRNIIVDGELTSERMNMFLQSIALLGKTTTRMIEDVLEIVDKRPSRQAYLTLGTLLSRHCGKVPEECISPQSNSITKAEEFLINKLGNSCEGQSNHERVEEIIMALKAIGNAHRPIRVRPTLIKCGKDAQHSNITRAAFDAFRGMPCDEKQSDDLLNVVTDENVEPEIRIHAFIALMNCPSKNVIDRVINALNREESNQVASFISTHLTNIMESSDIKNKEARTILEKSTKTTPLKKVNLPFYKFSQSYEKSLRIDSIRSGASVAGQIIYNSNGYFPKSGLLNFSAEVLGTEVNILEAAIAVDGLESVLANAFGPNGVLPDNFMLNIFNFTYTSEKLKEMAQKSKEQRTRQKHDAAGDKLSHIHNRINMKPTPPSGDFSIKIMGQEIRVFSYDDIYYMIDEIDNMNVVQLLMNAAKGGHKTFTKSMMFLELTHTVPTGLGLPLKLKLVGSTVASVELDGKFDIRNLFWGPAALNINGYLKPSAVVELSGQMGIESHFVRSGMFVNTSMYFSNMVKGSVQYQEGKLFKINVDTPSEPVQLFNISSTPFLYLNEEKTLIDGAPRRINPDFCMKSKILGYGLCTNLRLPIAFREYEAPYFPLSGPAYFGINLIRGDEKLNTFQFLIQMTKEASKTTGVIEFSTPGATYERKIGGKMVYTDIDNNKILILSTEKLRRRAEIEFGYNTMTYDSYITTRNNFFTEKDLTTTLKYFNQTNMISKQFGILFSAEFDWYRFEHITKYVQKTTAHMLHSSTTYYPQKSVTGVVEYNIIEKKLSARFDSEQLKQSAEVTGQWTVEGDKNGLTLTATHLSSGKTASIYGGYINKDGQKELIISATALEKTVTNVLRYYKVDGLRSVANVLDINGKIVRLSVSYDELKENKVVAFEADIFGHTANSDIVFVNKESEKSLKWIVSVADNVAMTQAGYYHKDGLKSLKWNMDIMGRKAEVFANIHSGEGYRTTFGGIFGTYTVGLRGIFTNKHAQDKSLCASAYYGTTVEEKEPMLWCLNYQTLGTTRVHKRLAMSAEHKELNKKVELEFDYEQHTGTIQVAGKVKWNGEVYGKNTYNLKYSDLKNAEIKMDVEVGKYNCGWKLYTETLRTATNLGVYAYFMDKAILFLNTFDKQIAESNTEMQWKTQLIVNGKTLPVSTELNFIAGEGIYEPSVKVNVGTYSFVYLTAITYTKSKYGYGTELIVTRGDQSLIKLFHRSSLLMDRQQELSQKFGVTAFGKTYEYGWETAYKNDGTAARSAHVLTFRLQYSTTRKSVVTFTFYNDKKEIKLLVDVEYVPGKKVYHIMKYSKEIRELNVSIEFLPKMFAKFIGRVESKNGYKLITNYEIQWDGYKKALDVVNNFVNKNKEMTLSTSIGKKISFGIKYLSDVSKTAFVFADLFDYSGKLEGVLNERNVQLRFIANKKMLINIVGDYDQTARQLTFSIEDAKKQSLFKITGGYNKFTQQIQMSIISRETEWFRINGLYSKKDRMVMLNILALEKQLLKVVGSRSNDAVTLSVMSLGKQILKAIASQSENAVSLNLSSEQIQRDITFKAAINKEEMSATVSVEYLGNKVGFTVRGDYKNYVLRCTGFLNKMESGWEMFIQRQAIVYKMMFTRDVSAQIFLEVQDDKILKMTLQRTNGKSIVNETAFQYTLSGEACKFMFKWNPETIEKMISKIDDLIRPVIKKVLSESTKFSKKAVEILRKFLEESTTNVKQATLNFLDRVDKSFDEFDFTGVRDKVGELSLKALQKVAELIRKTLITVAEGMETLKGNLPNWIQKTKEITAQVKGKLQSIRLDFEKNFNKINDLIYKVANNLTESTRPVINKAIELIKDFKFRDKPLKELAIMAKDLGKKYFDLSMEQGEMLLKDLAANSINTYNNVKTYVLKMNIPYRQETVEEVIEIVLNKAVEFKGKLNDANIQQFITEIRGKVLKFDIYGKPVEQHLIVLKDNLKNVPATTRKAILGLIRLVRVYSKKVQMVSRDVYMRIADFSEPASNHIKFVAKTIANHFGPLVNKATEQLKTRISSLEMPKMEFLTSARDTIIEKGRKLEKFFLPLLQPISALLTNIKEQVRQIQIMGFHVGPFVDMQIAMIANAGTEYMKNAKIMLDKQIYLLNTCVERYYSMSPEQMVDFAYDSSIDISNNIATYVDQIYQNREAMVERAMQQIKTIYKKLEGKYNEMKDIAVEKLFEELINESSERLIDYTDELARLLRQLADMDISRPTWKAWKEADIIGHLKQYGINDKIMNAIQAAKDVNLRKVVLNTVEAVKQFVTDVYAQAFIKAVQTYGKMENVVDYIRSIPKKEYDQWFQELKMFYENYEKRALNSMADIYSLSKENAISMYEQAKIMSKLNYNNALQTAKDYYEPTKDFCNTFYEKIVLVYRDVKQPTIDVANHYKSTVMKFAINELQPRIEAVYENFLNRFGDMTWEEVHGEIFKYGEQKYLIVKEYSEKQYQKYTKLVLELKINAEIQYKRYYAIAIAEYEKYKKIAADKYNELKPQVIKMYNDYMIQAKEAYNKKVEEIYKMYSDMKDSVTSIYNTHKDKTLIKIYLEVKSVIVEQLKKQYELARAGMNKKSEELKSWATKAIVLMNTIILPELRKETVSLINQSLRFSVVMANETVKAYYPHYSLIKDKLYNALSTMQKEVSVVFEQSNVNVKNTFDKLMKHLTELLEIVRNHEMYRKGMIMYNDAINHEYIKKIETNIQEIINIINVKIEELRNHPQYLAYRNELETRITMYKEQLEAYKSQIKQLYNKYSEHPKVIKAQRVMEQIKKSILFSYNQLTKKVIPQFEILFGMMTYNINNLPIALNKGFIYFRQEPEDAFWEAADVAKSASLEIYNLVKNVNVEKMKEKYNAYIVLANDLGKILLDECFDDWTKESSKQLYNIVVKNLNLARQKIKDFPQTIQMMAIKEYKERLDMITTWAQKQYEAMKQSWDKCPFKAVVTNRIWRDIADEIMRHELVDVSKTFVKLTNEKFIELKNKALEEFSRQRLRVEMKLKELKEQATNKYYKLKKQAEKKYSEMTIKYNELVEKAKDFVETTTIADIVDFIQTKYQKGTEKIQEALAEAMELKVKYVAEAERMYAQYAGEAKKMYEQMYTNIEEIVMKYKNKIMPYYLKYEAEGQKIYEKYYPIGMAKYEEWSNKVQEYYRKAQEKYEQTKALALKKFEELKVKSIEMYNEYKSTALTIAETAKVDAYNKWMDSEIRANLKALQKMSIRETIEALKKLPKQANEFAIATYNKYYSLALRRWEAEYQRFNDLKMKYTAELMTKRDELIQKLMPYTTPIFEAYNWLDNEVRETITFVYRYHKVQERYTILKNYVTSEYERIAPMVRPAMEKYAKECKVLAMKYADKYSVLAKDYAKKMISKAGHGTLRGIHSTLQYIDHIDVQAIKSNLKSKAEEYVNFVKRYVTIDTTKGEFTISIPCSATPSFKHHIATVKGRVRRSIQTVTEQTETLKKSILSEYNALKDKTNTLRNYLQQQLMENTVELREDFQTSLDINKKIAERVYYNVRIIAQKSYKNAIDVYEDYKPKAIEIYKQATTMAKYYYQKFLETSKDAYLKAGEMFWNMYKAGPTATYKLMKRNAINYSELIRNKVMSAYTKYEPVIKSKTYMFIDMVKAKSMEAMTEIEPYYRVVQTAVSKVKNGMTMEEAFEPIYKELVFVLTYYQEILSNKMTEVKKITCKSDPKLCKLVKDSFKVHDKIYEKYSRRALDMYTTGKSRAQRLYRIMKFKLLNKALLMPEYLDVAMVFGNHIITFDNKMFEIPNNPGCEYLLAHDFVDDTFTLKKKNDGFVIETPDMKVIIDADGTTKTKFGNKISNSLPIEFGSTTCLRHHHIITCHFAKQKLRMKVNLKTFMATISMSAWHFGKSQGLLGTNNRESFDDWKLPNGKITKDMIEFVNSYELSKAEKCQLKTVKTTNCAVKTPSQKCHGLFVDEKSTFAKYFRTVDPTIFYKACEQEITDCSNKLSDELRHCRVALAYVTMARTRGSWISHLPECLHYDSHAPNEEWTQKPIKKQVDVVLLMSQSQNNAGTNNRIEKVLTRLQSAFKSNKYDSRFALVGFGGFGVHEPAHIHPLGKGHDVFGSMEQLAEEVNVMSYDCKDTTTNDVYHAILEASRLTFRPTAMRVFILVNEKPHTAFKHGPAMEETLFTLTREADAILYVFGKFTSKPTNATGKFIGLSTKRLYTTRDIQGTEDYKENDYPISEFKAMVKATNGGWFASNMHNTKETAKALYHDIDSQMETIGQLCKVCRLESTYTDVPRPICRANINVKC